MNKALLLAGAISSLLAHPQFATAAVRYVTTGGTDTGDCSSQASPCRTLPHAFGQSSSGDTIKLASGKYKAAIASTNFGHITISGSWDEAFLSQDDGNPTRLSVKDDSILDFHFTDTDGSISIDHLVLEKASVALSVSTNGPATVSVSLDHVVIQKNKFGGAALSTTFDSGEMPVSVTNCTFQKNKGLLVSALDVATAPVLLTIEDSVFEKNKGSSSLASDVVFVAAATWDEQYTGSIQIARSRFVGNKGRSLHLVAASVELTMDMYENVFLANKSESAVVEIETMTPPVEAITTVAVDSFNNTIARNKATEESDAALLVSSQHGSIVLNSTNDIVHGNLPDNYRLEAGSEGSVTLNRSYGIYGTGQVLAGATLNTGTGILDVDPLLEKKKGNPHLLPESPAIDAGTCSGASAIDFEGDARPTGAGCDIGADEVAP